MEIKTPKLNLTRNTVSTFKVKTNVKAGEGTGGAGAFSYNKIKWTY